MVRLEKAINREIVRFFPSHRNKQMVFCFILPFKVAPLAFGDLAFCEGSKYIPDTIQGLFNFEPLFFSKPNCVCIQLDIPLHTLVSKYNITMAITKSLIRPIKLNYDLGEIMIIDNRTSFFLNFLYLVNQYQFE